MDKQTFDTKLEYLAVLHIFNELEKETNLSKKDIQKVKNVLDKKYNVFPYLCV